MSLPTQLEKAQKQADILSRELNCYKEQLHGNQQKHLDKTRRQEPDENKSETISWNMTSRYDSPPSDIIAWELIL